MLQRKSMLSKGMHMLPRDACHRAYKTRSSCRRRSNGAFLLSVACAALSILSSTLPTLAFIAGAPSAQARVNASRVRPAEVSLLSPGVAVGREIKGGETHLFGVSMEAGQYASLTLRRLAVDLLVTVRAPGQGVLTSYESPAGPQSPLALSIIAPASGVYILEVSPVDKWAAAGRY